MKEITPTPVVLLVALLSTSAGCNCDNPDLCSVAAPSGVFGAGDFPLSLGETTRTGFNDGDVALTFTEVRQDDRCRVAETRPCTVVDGCSGAPTAMVVLDASTATTQARLLFELPAYGGAVGGRQSFASVSLNVYLLEPQVESAEAIPAEDYFVRINVARAP